MRTIALCLVLALAGCRSTEKQPAQPPTFADRIASTHGVEDWKSNKVLAGRIQVAFQNRPTLDVRFIHDIHTGRTRMQTADGTLMLWDGNSAWVSPASSPMQMARFHLLTWPYFLSVPFKLHDPGVQLSDVAEGKLSGKTFATARMTFAPGTGDAPDDWYILYADPQTARLEALAYIVTYGRSKAAAEEEPHAVTFYDFKRIDGVLVPHEWRFWKWNKNEGLYGEPEGRAIVSDLAFVPLKPGQFTRPADAREDKLPQ